jgi:type I restriction enzyme S subunit
MKQREYDYYGASGVIDKVDEYLFDDDLILIAEDGANLVLRNLPLSIIARGKFWVNNHAHILKPKKGNLEYFANLLEVIDYRQWITGAAQPKLTQDRLMAIKVPVPQVEEQIKIVDFIAAETSTLIDVIKRTKREVELIREYRKRIIADVVTGKVDVRHLAAETGELTLDDAEVLVNATDLLMDEEAEDLEASEEELTLADD